MNALPAMIGAGVEQFTDSNAIPSSSRSALVSLLTLIVVLGLILLFGQFLWNNALVPLVPGVKPARSVLQILGLAILISLLSPSCC
jgi:hypothetical protein